MLDIAILVSILENNKYKYLLSDLKPELFLDEYRKVWDFILQFEKKYSAIPTIETVCLETGFKVPPEILVDEPIDFYLDKIKQRFLRNLLKEELEPIVKIVDSDPYQAAKNLRITIKNISSKLPNDRGVVNWADQAEADKRIVNYYTRKAQPNLISGIPTPWPDINLMTSGIERRKFWILSAKLKTGKTWEIGPVLARHAWRNGYKPLIISPEVSIRALSERMDSAHSYTSYAQFRQGKLGQFVEQKYIDTQKHLFEMGPMWIAGDGLVKSMSDIQALHDKLEPDIIFIDGIYMINPGSTKVINKYERVSALCEEIQEFVQRDETPIVATTQFKRTVGGQQITGEAEDVGYAYEIPQYCDVFIGLFRNDHLRNNNQIAIKLLENREGDKINIVANFNLETMNFDQVGTYTGDTVDTMELSRITPEFEALKWNRKA